jgi:hypothetical protein
MRSAAATYFSLTDYTDAHRFPKIDESYWTVSLFTFNLILKTKWFCKEKPSPQPPRGAKKSPFEGLRELPLGFADLRFF